MLSGALYKATPVHPLLKESVKIFSCFLMCLLICLNLHIVP